MTIEDLRKGLGQAREHGWMQVSMDLADLELLFKRIDEVECEIAELRPVPAGDKLVGLNDEMADRI